MTTLTLDDRLALLEILPREGNLITLRAIRELREDLSLNDEELETLEPWQDGDVMRWELEKATKLTKEFDFGKTALDTIVSALKKREEQETLPEKCLGLYETFVLPTTE